MRVLYLSYDGMTDALGQAQVLPYLEGLSRLGHRIVLVSHEKRARDADRPRLAGRVAAADIEWVALRYHARPRLPATIYDIGRMVAEGARLHARTPFDLVHCRSYVAGAAGLALRRSLGIPFLFDMRGFWIDERAASGNLRAPVQERLLRGLERRLLLGADAVVVLARRGIETLWTWPYVRREHHDRFVHISTCVDLPAYAGAFAARRARVATLREPRTFTYLGAVGLWHAPEAIVRFVGVVRRRLPDARFRFLVSDGRELLEAALATAGVRDGFSFGQVPHAEVPAELATSDVGFYFIRPSAADPARAPTKLGELLAAGLPVATAAGVGDVDDIVARHRVGAIARSLEPAAMEACLDELLARWRDGAVELADRCRRAAEACFSLADGVAAYDALYRRLARASTRSG